MFLINLLDLELIIECPSAESQSEWVKATRSRVKQLLLARRAFAGTIDCVPTTASALDLDMDIQENFNEVEESVRGDRTFLLCSQIPFIYSFRIIYAWLRSWQRGKMDRGHVIGPFFAEEEYAIHESTPLLPLDSFLSPNAHDSEFLSSTNCTRLKIKCTSIGSSHPVRGVAFH